MRVLLVLGIWVTSPSVWGAEGGSCKEVFQKAFDVLAEAVHIEKRIQILEEVNMALSSGGVTELSRVIEKNQRDFEDFVLKMDAIESDAELHNQIGFFARNLDAIENQAALLQQRELVSDFSQVIENPRVMRADYIYSFEGMDPHLKGVSFSKDVVESIFWSSEPHMHMAANLIFRALARGRSHAVPKSGIFKFEEASDVWKVKIKGPTVVGAIRLGGYFQGETFHIVYWSNEASHGNRSVNQMINAVHRRMNLARQ